jgi:hypothetical protein
VADDNAPKKNKDIIQQILLESKAYTNVEMMESLVDSEKSLALLPIQPLYMAIKNLSSEQLAPHLSKFSPEQRTRFLDLDLWFKDTLDVDSFSFWVNTYLQSKSLPLLKEFTQSSEFSIYLKGVFNIWTFDLEDPQYPDHDNYFLTDDNLLLFEFHEGYEHADEVRALIRSLYGELGVENAYSYLFKITSESFLLMQEEEYQAKNYRLAEVGFVDYFDALKMDSYFSSQEVMDHYIKNYETRTPSIEGITIGQTLHNASLTAFKGEESFREELEKVKDGKRKDFLHFNFIRLVNGTLALNNALKSGTLAMTRVGTKTCSLVELGYSYVSNQLRIKESLFEKFDFVDFYRVGNTLIGLTQKKLKRGLRENSFDEGSEFLGKNWSEFLDYSFDQPVKYVAPEGEFEKPVIVKELDVLQLWIDRSETLLGILPFASTLAKTFKDLSKESKLMDHFYLNYSVDEIDFVAIMLSSLANYSLGNYENDQNSKMGLTINEFKTFVTLVMDTEGKVSRSNDLKKLLDKFTSQYGLKEVFNIHEMITEMLVEQLEGYDYSELNEADFKHVGGPIILNLS